MKLSPEKGIKNAPFENNNSLYISEFIDLQITLKSFFTWNTSISTLSKSFIKCLTILISKVSNVVSFPCGRGIINPYTSDSLLVSPLI